MKVAILSPIAWRTPPRLYGPWEQVASNIAECLVEKGIDVTLFATGDSITKGHLAYTCEQPYAEHPSFDVKVEECLHISYLFECAGEFDLIHNHYDFLPLTYSKLVNTPMITTIHGFSSPLIVPVYKKYDDTNHYVSISNANRHPDLQYTTTVYNGIDTAAFDFVEKPDDYLLFFGRIHPEKGTREAIEVAKQCRKKLIIAGLIQDELYFNNHVHPAIDDNQIVYAGNCGPAERNQLLGNATALLHLISFDEPFGLSVVEAMCCGTPVIAMNRGAMPELIRQGETGYLVQTMEEAVNAVQQLKLIRRSHCRQWATTMFSKERMTAEYLRVYENILAT